MFSGVALYNSKLATQSAQSSVSFPGGRRRATIAHTRDSHGDPMRESSSSLRSHVYCLSSAVTMTSSHSDYQPEVFLKYCVCAWQRSAGTCVTVRDSFRELVLSFTFKGAEDQVGQLSRQVPLPTEAPICSRGTCIHLIFVVCPSPMIP